MMRFVLCAGALGFALVGCAAPAPPDEGGASREAEAAQQAPAKSRQEAEADEPPVFRGHTKHIDFVAFSPDFSKLVTVANPSGDRTGRVWDARTGRELCRLALPAENGDHGAVSGLWFTADGAKVVTDGYATRARPRAVRTWDAQTGRLLRERAELDDETRPPATGHPPRGDGRLPAAVVSADGKRKLEGGRLLDLTTGQPLMWATGQRVLFATNGAFPASYDHLFPGPDGVNVTLAGLALSADGARAASGVADPNQNAPGRSGRGSPDDADPGHRVGRRRARAARHRQGPGTEADPGGPGFVPAVLLPRQPLARTRLGQRRNGAHAARRVPLNPRNVSGKECDRRARRL